MAGRLQPHTLKQYRLRRTRQRIVIRYGTDLQTIYNLWGRQTLADAEADPRWFVRIAVLAQEIDRRVHPYLVTEMLGGIMFSEYGRLFAIAYPAACALVHPSHVAYAHRIEPVTIAAACLVAGQRGLITTAELPAELAWAKGATSSTATR